jgi:tetratricopeptide (TPR) repeat protein
MRRSHPFRWAVLGAVAVLAVGAAVAAFVLLRDEPVAGRPLVAVTDMQNGTGDPELDGLSGLLVTSLEQSRRIGVMTRGRMLDVARRAGHEKVERIDEVVGRDIGRKAGATALLVANVHRLGTTYAIEVRAIDPLRDAYIFTLRDQSPSKEGIIPLIDRMSDQVRREFHEPAGDLAGNRARLESMVTGNLDAYRHYFVARTLIEGIHHPEAVGELERALAVDPGFALAHYQLSRMGGLGEIDEATRRRHEEAALRAKDRLPPRERGLLLASSASEAGRLDESEAGYRQLARDFPDDPEVLLPLGELLLVQERPVEAAVFLERAVDLEPTNEVAMAYLLRALGFLGRSEELLASARRAVATAPGPAAELFLAEAFLWAGDPVGAAGAARRAIALGEGQARFTLAVAGLRSGDSSAVRDATLPDPVLLAAIALFQGRLQAARASLEEEVDAGGWNAQLALERVHLRVGIGPGPELRGASDRLAATGSPNVGSAAAAVAWAGEMEAAARLASPLRPALASAALYRAVVLRRESRLEEALPALRTLATTHASDSSFLDSFFLGEAALAAGRPEEAVQALARFQRMNVPVHVLAWAYPRSLLLLARAEEARGRLPEARAALERLGRAWSDADPGSPPLAELAELRERLAR